MANVPKKTLAGVVGAAAAALLFSMVPKFEGLELVARPDPIGIFTACNGDTKDVRAGQRRRAPGHEHMHKPGDEKRSVVILRPEDYDEWLHTTNVDAARTM